MKRVRHLRVLVCGARDWHEVEPISREISSRLNKIRVIIEGDAPGADKIAGTIAETLKELGYPILHLSFPAQWTTYGKAAGPIRNTQMLESGKPNLVLAFHKDISKSKGTKNMVAQAEAAGVKCLIFKR